MSLNEKSQPQLPNLFQAIIDLFKSNTKLSQMNRVMLTLLENTDVVMLFFDKNGICINECSRATVEFLGMDPKGKKLPEVLRIPPEDWESFLEWYAYLQDPHLDFYEMAAMGPSTLPHPNYNLQIKYRLVRNENKASHQLNGVIVTLKDRTSELDSARQIKHVLNDMDMITQFLNDRDAFFKFIDLYNKNVETLQLLSARQELPEKNEVLRMLHTIKGCAGTLYIQELKEKAHELEDFVISFWNPSRSSEEIRSEIQKLQKILENTLNDFKLKYNYLFRLQPPSQENGSVLISKQSLKDFYDELVKSKNPSLKTKFVAELLTTPLYHLLSPLERSTVATARRLNKNVEVSISGPPQLRIFADYYRDVFENLIHITNNSLDHGIEPESIRIRNGKSAAGKITIEYTVANDRHKNELLIQISDDGMGINPTSIRLKMLNKFGIDISHESDTDVLRHIFQMGFSTSSVLSEISGRGIGMNAVLKSIQQIGGEINVSSTPQKGTKFSIRLPLINEHNYEKILAVKAS